MCFVANILKPMGDKTDKLIDFYKSCIDISECELLFWVWVWTLSYELYIIFFPESRIEAGIDPLLRIIRELLPSSFQTSMPEEEDILEEAVRLGKHFKESEFFSVFVLPNNSISVMIYVTC